MNVTPIVNTGLRFDLKHYQALKTSYAGTNLWFVNNSELLRNKLYPFLPRMEYDAGTNTVTASIVENGRELLSTSEAATPSLNNVPVSELQKLEKLIHDLLAEAAKDDTPDNVKQLVNAFPLPKPNSMPECYRLYGTGANKRLAIIWGLARRDAEGNEDASSVVSLKDFTYGLEYTPKKNYTWLWILLGLAAAGIGICYTLDKQTAPPVIIVSEDKPEVLTPEQRQLPVPQQIEILNEKEKTVSQKIAEIEGKQAQLKKKLADMDQQSTEAEASRKELDDLLAQYKTLKTELDAIKTTRTELEKTPAPEVITEGQTEDKPEVLTPEQRQLPVPQQIEILNEKEKTVSQQIAEIEGKQKELKDKLAHMDQQSAEAEASRKELDDLLAQYKTLKTELDAIKTTRTELEKTPAPEVADGENKTPEVGSTSSGDVDEPKGATELLTPEQRRLPVPQQIEILNEKEKTVSQKIAEIEGKQKELKDKLAGMDQQSAEAEASRKELDALLDQYKTLKTELDAIKTTRTELEKTLAPEGTTEGQTEGEPKGQTEDKPKGRTEEEPVVIPEGQTEEETKGKTEEETKERTEEEPVVIPEGQTEAETKGKTEAETKERTEEEPVVIPEGQTEEESEVLTEAEKQLPVEEQLKVLDRKEEEIKKEVDKLEKEQTTLQNELDVIAQKQKQSAGVVDKLTKCLKEYKELAAKLKRKDLSPEERTRLTERKKVLEKDIEQAEQQLETVPYNTKKARLEAIDKQLEEYKQKNRQIDQCKKTLQSATPPREVKVTIYKEDDYKVTRISHEPIEGSDKVRVKLNISSLKADQKFTRITVGKVQATADGDVVIDLTAGAQKLQLKIWVDSNPEPQYITPIYVNTSVIEQ